MKIASPAVALSSSKPALLCAQPAQPRPQARAAMPDRPPPRAPPRRSPSPTVWRGSSPRAHRLAVFHSFPHSPSLWFALSQEQRPRAAHSDESNSTAAVHERLGEPYAAQMLDQFQNSASLRRSRSTSPLPRLAGQPVAVQPDEADQLVERGGLCNRPHSPGGAGAQGACSGAIGRAQGGKEEGSEEGIWGRIWLLGSNHFPS